MAVNPQITLLLDFYGDMLTEKQRNMIDYYYNNDLSLGEIAQNEGITRQGVRDSIKRAEAQMVEMEERLGLAARFSELQEGLEEIKLRVAVIEEINSRSGNNYDISKHIDAIKLLAERLIK
jgi:predicted DNA-binding protein YlxM (UPF0122 family)